VRVESDSLYVRIYHVIEVEKKFPLDAGNLEKITEGAQFVSEKTHTDVYYDTKDLSLVKTNTWLRKRNDRYELKIPTYEALGENSANQYHELETDVEIAAYLHFDTSIPLAQSLATRDYEIFCTITTTRKKYKNSGFTIDIDSCDFGYEMVEVELVVEDTTMVKEANEKILAFGKKIGLTSKPILGKVSEYLRRYSPEHYQAIVNARTKK
jgi:predicted adenylyl cyclase CyaB